jgi:CheY-like chemotaxis protein
VIDDHQGLIDLFGRYLEGSDYQLLSARTVREGLQIAQRELPDIVVLDVMMPTEDGWTALQRLRNSEQTSHLPVIICSVIDDPELAYSLGAVYHLPKPVSRAQLLEALRRCHAGRL